MPLSKQTAPAASENIKTADLIVHGRYVVTMVKDNPIIEHGAVAIRDGIIVAVGSGQEISANYTSEKVIAGGDRIVLPGLINGHTHAAMVLFRGIADDIDLMDWLQDYIFPLEGRFVDPEFIEVGMKLACLEMIRGGTTSFVDMYFYADQGADIIEASGLRAIVSHPSIDFPCPGSKDWDDGFATALGFIKKGKSKSGRVIPAFGPHSPYSVSRDHMAQLCKAAKDLNIPITTHLSESLAELKFIKENFDSTPIRYLENLGLLDNKLIAAHVVHPTEGEIELLVKNKVGVIHNPTSNLKTGVGIAPIAEMLKMGVCLGLGTDGAASNNDLDMWGEIRLAALIHKGVQKDATVMPAQSVMEMATTGGAKAVGLDHIVGDITVGKRADLIQVDLSGPHMTPLYDVISHLVYAVSSSDVVTTIVDGNILMEDGNFLTLDAEDIRQKANEIAARIKQALHEA